MVKRVEDSGRGEQGLFLSLSLSRISTDVGEPWATRGRRCGHTGGLWRLSTGPCERLRFFSWKNGFSVSLNSVAGAPRTIVMSYYSADDGPQRTSTTRTRPRRTPKNRENATEERGGEGGEGGEEERGSGVKRPGGLKAKYSIGGRHLIPRRAGRAVGFEDSKRSAELVTIEGVPRTPSSLLWQLLPFLLLLSPSFPSFSSPFSSCSSYSFSFISTSSAFFFFYQCFCTLAQLSLSLLLFPQPPSSLPSTSS